MQMKKLMVNFLFDLDSFSEFSIVSDVERCKTNNDDDFDTDNLEEAISLMSKQVKNLSDKLINEQERNLCIICFLEPINSIFLQCGHKSTCYRCGTKFSQVSHF